MKMDGTRIRTLVIHPMLAPYRVDLFNAVAQHLDLEVVFQRRELTYHRALDQNSLRASLRCRYGYLTGNRVIFQRDIPTGIGALIKAREPDVVVTSEFSLATLLASWARGRRGPAFGHIIWSDENPWTLVHHNLIRLWLRWLCTRRVDAMLMCSPEVAEGFSRRFGVDRQVIHRVSVHQSPATLRRRLAESGPAAAELVRCRGLSGRRVLLYVGRLAREKNLFMALRAFASAAPRQPDLVLALVGSGEEQSRLQALAEQLGVGRMVIFGGHCEGVRLFAWYRIACALVLASTAETYGAVVNEALVCGLPVLCSSRAGAAHLVRNAVNGWNFDPSRQDAIARAVDELKGLGRPAEVQANELREDLMPIAFEEDPHNFVAAVHQAARARTAAAACLRGARDRVDAANRRPGEFV